MHFYCDIKHRWNTFSPLSYTAILLSYLRCWSLVLLKTFYSLEWTKALTCRISCFVEQAEKCCACSRTRNVILHHVQHACGSLAASWGFNPLEKGNFALKLRILNLSGISLMESSWGSWGRSVCRSSGETSWLSVAPWKKWGQKERVGLWNQATEIGWEGMSLSSGRRESVWILGKVFLWKSSQALEPRRWWSRCPRRCSRTVDMGHWGLVGMVGVCWGWTWGSWRSFEPECFYDSVKSRGSGDNVPPDSRALKKKTNPFYPRSIPAAWAHMEWFL